MLGKRGKKNLGPIPSWQNNLPASQQSSKEFGLLHTKRNLTEMEWIEYLQFMGKKNMLPYILLTSFWDRMKTCFHEKIPVSKSSLELKKDFFTKVVPNRKNFPANLIPKLHLKHSDPESSVVIFHEVQSDAGYSTSINSLITDGLLSDLMDWEAWFHEFVEALFCKTNEYFLTTETEFQLVKTKTIEYFFQNVAPKICFSGNQKYREMIEASIDEIALTFDEELQ